MRFIGCKTLLLENIKQVLDEKAPEAKIFCDAVELMKEISGDVLYVDFGM